jgi:hypothetical protein
MKILNLVFPLVLFPSAKLSLPNKKFLNVFVKLARLHPKHPDISKQTHYPE